MKLTLEATGQKKDMDRLGAARSATFTEEGGTIGRNPGNDWPLKNELVSKFHAEIAFENGVFTIEDLDSANGTYINGSRTRLESGARHQLRDGDTLFIDPFTIEVRVGADAARPGRSALEPAPVAPGARGGGDGGANPYAIMSSTPDWTGQDETAESDEAPFSEHFPLSKPEEMPADKHADSRVPDDYDPSQSVIRPAVAIPSEPPPRHTPPAPNKRPSPSPYAVRSSPSGHDNLALVLSKAGLAHVDITPELVETLAKVLRTVVDGLMDVFDARKKFKAALDIEHTQFKARQTAPVNNPLKFSSSVEDALTKLFVETPPGYMRPLPAFEDAFADLCSHELAMTSGITAAFAKVLEAFDPDDLEKLFDDRARASLVPKPGAMRYWDQYRQMLAEMANEAGASDRLLKEPFASAYKSRLEQLRAAKRGAS